VCGYDPNCDIVLPHRPGISSRHGAFTFDKHNRFIYRDLGSPDGSEVIYREGQDPGQGQGRRQKFDWILGGHKIPGPADVDRRSPRPFPQLLGSTSVAMTLSRQHTSPMSVRFARVPRMWKVLLDEADLSPSKTQAASRVYTPPGKGPITLKKKLGKGGFGVVWHVWDVSTGEEHALKEPPADSIKKGTLQMDWWTREAAIMGQISHVSNLSLPPDPALTGCQPNIVKFLGTNSEPSPGLASEYIPGGDLYHQTDITP